MGMFVPDHRGASVRYLGQQSHSGELAGWVAFSGVLLLLCGCPMTPPPDTISDPIVPNSDGSVSTIAGTGTGAFAGDTRRATSSQLNRPTDIAVASDGALLIADFGNNRVRRVDLATGLINTIAGDGSTTGPAAINGPAGVTALAGGEFAVAAWGEHRVYRYSLGGARSVIIGDGSPLCFDGAADVAAPAQPAFAPRSVDLLADGSALVAEQGCHRVRRVRVDGTVSNYAGTADAGFGGDGGDATSAMLHAGAVVDGPSFGLSLSPEDPPDELFIADTENHVIRVVKPFTGRIQTFAGSGEAGFIDGAPEQARFNRPTHVFCPPDHSLWIADSGNHAIRYVDPLRTRVITIIGTGAAGFNGDDRPPAETQLNNPSGVCISSAGHVFVADTDNHRVRLFRRP